MLCKIVTLVAVFGVTFAEPVARLASPIPDDLELSGLSQPARNIDNYENVSNLAMQRLFPEGTHVILDVVSALAGYKFTAISLGVLVIEWLISNAVVIFIGAAAAIGLCKITGKCNFNYESYIPVASLRSYVTPEYLETAEKFFLNAMEKYAEKKARSAQNKSWLN